MAMVPTRRRRGYRGLGLVPFTGTYDPAIDSGEGYAVDAGSAGAFDQAKSAYEIAQLHAAGVTNVVYDPYTRTYVDGDTTTIFNATGTGPDASQWTAADQSALETRIATVLNDPNATTAAKQLVQLPGYGTPDFDAQLNDGSNPALAQTVSTLLQQSSAQYVAPAPVTTQDYLVGGKHFSTLADAQAAAAQLTAAGVTLLSQVPGAAPASGGAAGGVAGVTDPTDTADVWGAGAGDSGSGGGASNGGVGGASSSLSSLSSGLEMPVLLAAGALALVLVMSRKRGR